MKRCILFVFVALLVLGPRSNSAQVRIVKSAGAAVGVDLSGVKAIGAAAQKARRTLELDLSRSGWMKLAAPGQAAIFVRGNIAETNGKVAFTCSVTDATGRVYLNAAYAQPAAQAVQLAHQAANDVVVKTTGKPTFFLAKLALIGVSGNAKELFQADSSAQEIRPVTQDRTISLKPRWSPDNRLISYTSYLQRYPDVYTIDVATGRRTRVSFYPGVNSGGAIAPNGRSMALILSKDGNPELYVKDLPTGRLTRLTTTPHADEGSPSWSPDGNRIVYVSNASRTPQLYVVSSAGGPPQQLTTRGSQNVAPDWGANGLIAYQTLSGNKFQIAVMDPATQQAMTITPHDASYEDPSWAPDGRHLAAARAVGYDYSVYLLDYMAELGDKPVPLTTAGEWTAPAWSR